MAFQAIAFDTGITDADASDGVVEVSGLRFKVTAQGNWSFSIQAGRLSFAEDPTYASQQFKIEVTSVSGGQFRYDDFTINYQANPMMVNGFAPNLSFGGFLLSDSDLNGNYSSNGSFNYNYKVGATGPAASALFTTFVITDVPASGDTQNPYSAFWLDDFSVDTDYPPPNATPTIANIPAGSTQVVTDQATALPDFTVADGDNDALTVTLSATNGTINGLVDADSGVAGIQLTGTAAQINAQIAAATFTATADGSASIGIRVTDGKSSPVSRTLNLTAATPDITPPAAPSTPDLAAGSDTGTFSTDNLTNVTTPTLTGTAEARSTIRLYDTDGITLIGTGTAVGGTWSIATSSLSIGTHTITARATDAAGNTSAASAPLSVTVDTAAPTLSISSNLSSLKVGQTATITFTFSEDPGSSFTWDGTTGDITVSGGTLSALSGTGLTRTAIFTPSADTNGGMASITVAAGSYADSAGNNGTAGAMPSLHFDTLAPGAPSALVLAAGSDTGISNSDKLTANDRPTFAGSAEGGATVTLYDTDGTEIGSGTVVGSTWSITPTAALANGAHTITATVRDATGNVSAVSAGLEVTIDKAAPTLTISSSRSVLKAGETATITFTFSEDPGATFTAADISVAGGTLGPLSGSGLTRIAVFTPTTGVNGGTASITVAASAYTDTAGNPGGTGTMPALAFDTRAPAVPSTPDMDPASDIGDSDSDDITGDTTPTFTGTAEVGATVTLYDGATAIGSTVAIDGTWHITSDRSLARGSHSITARATDLAGNNSPVSSALTIHVVTDAPTTQVNIMRFSDDTGASVTDSVTRSAIQTISGALDANLAAGERVEVSFDNGNHWSVANAAAGSTDWSLATTLAAGTHTIAVRVADAIGNSGPVHTQIYTLDTSAPTVTISSSNSQLKVGESATITFTLSEDPGASFSWDGSVGDIIVNGGTLSAISGSGLTRTAVFTPDAGVNTGSAGISVLVGSYADAAGNTGTAGSTPSLTFDTLAPAAPTLALALDSGVAGDLVTNLGQVLVSGLEAGAVWQYSTDAGASWITGSGSSFTLQGAGIMSAVVRQLDQAGNVSLNSAPLIFTLSSPLAAGADAASMSWLAAHADNVLANDSEPGGNALTVTGVSFGNAAGSVGASLQGQFGMLTLQSDGTYRYVATRGDLASGQSGVDQFTYSISDSSHQTASTTLTFTVTSNAVSEVAGTQVRDPDHAAGQIYRLYDTLLDRHPDSLGVESWVSALEGGASLSSVAQSILQSSEFTSSFGNLDNRAFVDLLYLQALGRPADATSQGWVSLLEQGVSRAEIAVGISESGEHRDLTQTVFDEGLYLPNPVASEVARLYHAALGRIPDSSGLVDWTKALESGSLLSDVADGFVFSFEFQSAYGSLSNRQFVEQLYLNALDRPGDAAGLANWAGLLDSGQMDRGDVLVGFSESTEFKVKMQPLFDNGILIA